MSENLKRKFGLSVMAVMIAGSVGGGLLSLTASAADPVIASCSGAVSTSTIVWRATSTGGTPPYTYIWSGTNISGTASSVIAVYAAAGAFQAMVQVNDSATSTATSTCS